MTLWWKHCYTNIQEGVYVTNTWDDVIHELKRKFTWGMELWKPRFVIRNQTGTIHDFVKEFTNITFEIHVLYDEDPFVYFFNELKGRPETELERCGVKDLASTITKFEDFVYFDQKEPLKS